MSNYKNPIQTKMIQTTKNNADKITGVKDRGLSYGGYDRV